VTDWGCSVVGIGFVSSIWLIGLIVEEDPVNRMFATLSKKGNLPELHSVGNRDPALGLVAATKRQPSPAPPTHPETPLLLRLPGWQRQRHPRTVRIGGF
jgi:hypothetical protein